MTPVSPRIHRRLGHLALLASIGVTLGACVADPEESWLPQEVEVADTLERVGHKAYSIMCDQFESTVYGLYSSQLLVKAACTAYALSSTPNAATCAQVTDECLGTLPPPVEAQLESILAQAHCEHVGVTSVGCSAPVSELVECLEELRFQLEEIKLTATCAAFGSPVPSDWWRITPPQSCIDLATRCPAALSGR